MNFSRNTEKSRTEESYVNTGVGSSRGRRRPNASVTWAKHPCFCIHVWILWLPSNYRVEYALPMWPQFCYRDMPSACSIRQAKEIRQVHQSPSPSFLCTKSFPSTRPCLQAGIFRTSSYDCSGCFHHNSSLPTK